LPFYIVADNPEDLDPLPGATIVSARKYLAEARFANLRNARVLNLCRSHRYQSIGYYVSLLAEARGHKPLPCITTMQDMKSQSIMRLASDECKSSIDRCLDGQKCEKLSFNIYFGHTPEPGRERLAACVFKLFYAPFIRADFSRNGTWNLQNVSPLGVTDIPAFELAFARDALTEYVEGHRVPPRKRSMPHYHLAILHNPDEAMPPSTPKSLKRFIKAAEELGIAAELITREDSRRLSEFDGLFIRETTDVNHHTYRLASRAVAEGLVVIDDPQSILRCSNKVYLSENLHRHGIRTPKTLVLHHNNLEEAPAAFAFPFVLKQPDSSFSQGVVKVADEAQYEAQAKKLLKRSELIIAQEFLPTPFDWRIGILDRKPLFACKYFMARKHWQIINNSKAGKDLLGRVEAVPLDAAPKNVVKTALKAAGFIGDGLYGVDLKVVGRKVHVIEINDNPNIDAGLEDAILKSVLYTRVMDVFLRRMEQRKRGNGACS
jgi:glutathione synthase/RimK-type ligase-like ATP-grasp enzyme